LGLANHPEIREAAREAIDKYGFGLSSVRFISGTESIHKILEKKLAEFLGTEDSILYSTNFMSNLGFFATITNETFGESEPYMDAIYSDELNHASIIDAFKLCKKENIEIITNKGISSGSLVAALFILLLLIAGFYYLINKR
jgi:glycine C-acetyltransferase